MDIKELRVGNKIWRPDCYDEVVEIRENGIIGLDSLRGRKWDLLARRWSLVTNY